MYRLIAALSDELFVIEAGRNSGTESTVKYCGRYGRKIEFPEDTHLEDAL